MNRKLYRTHFEVRNTIDPKTGKPKRTARYIGPYYRLTLPMGQRRALLVRLWACLAALVACFLVCGLINTDSSRCVYVAPLYLLQIAPLIFLAMGIYHLARLKDKWTAIDKAETVDSIQHCAWGLTLLSGLALTGQIVFFFVEKELANLTGDIIFTAGLALAVAAGVYVIRLSGGIPYEKCEEGQPTVPKEKTAQ